MTQLSGIPVREVRTPWYHIHSWRCTSDPPETREAPVESTPFTLKLQSQVKVFCRCGTVRWEQERTCLRDTERWELMR